MATKSSNPLKDATSALQFLLMLTPPESRQQALRAASIIKQQLDKQRSESSELATLTGQNDVLRQQIVALNAELTAIQFAPESEPEVQEERKRGRKGNAQSG